MKYLDGGKTLFQLRLKLMSTVHVQSEKLKAALAVHDPNTLLEGKEEKAESHIGKKENGVRERSSSGVSRLVDMMNPSSPRSPRGMKEKEKEVEKELDGEGLTLSPRDRDGSSASSPRNSQDGSSSSSLSSFSPASATASAPVLWERVSAVEAMHFLPVALSLCCSHLASDSSTGEDFSMFMRVCLMSNKQGRCCCCVVVWMVGWLVIAGWLVGWLVGYSWLAGWLVGWLID